MKKTVVQWVVIAILVLLVAFGNALVNRDMYTKAEVNDRIDLRVEPLKEQTNRIEKQVDKLVDHLIEEGGDGD